MNELLIKILINFVIFIVVFVGFFIFWGKSSGWFEKDGFVYEWWNQKKLERKAKKDKK